MWAITVAHAGHNWGFYMLLTELPSYMDSVLHINLKSVLDQPAMSRKLNSLNVPRFIEWIIVCITLPCYVDCINIYEYPC